MRFLGPSNSTDNTKILKSTYMVTIALLLLAVVFTPIFIRHHFLLFKKYVLQEDAAEALLIGILLLTGYLLSNIYKKELKKYRQEKHTLIRDKNDLSHRLTDAFKYIGGVNVQIQQIRSIFCALKRYPATENALKKDLALFARKLLEIVNADWVMIRIICQNNLRTMKEHFEPRKKVDFNNKRISNKAIVANRSIEEYSFVTSHHDNSVVMGVCVFPKRSLDEEEKILVEAIINQIEMHYLIYVARRIYEIYPDFKTIRRNSDKN